ARAVGGLQGGRAPARAFAAFMKVAVANRPVEEFDTKLQLPDWQLEPDDEMLTGNPEDYYFVDEDGNLIEPGPGQGQAMPPPEDPQVNVRRGSDRNGGQGQAPAAASDDFLERAIGGGAPPDADPGLRQAPPPPN